MMPATPPEQCLVTGGTGLIGLVLVRLLKAQGHRVRVLVRPSSDVSELTDLGVETVLGDVCEADTLPPAMAGVDTVYHLAVQRHMRKGTKAEHRAGDRSVTVDGAVNVARAAAAAGVRRMVQASSSGLAGSTAWKVITETTPTRPDRPYRQLRAEAERALSSVAAETGLALTIARITHVFGPRDLQLLEMFRLIAEGKLNLFGNGAQVHHFSYVDDVAGGLMAAASAAQPDAQVYLIGSPPRPLWRFLSEIAEATGGSVRRHVWMTPLLRPVARLYDALGRPMDARTKLGRKLDFHVRPWHCDISKSQRDLALPDPVPLPDAVARTVAWYRDQGHL